MILIIILSGFIIGASFARSWRDAALWPMGFVVFTYVAVSQIFGGFAAPLDTFASLLTATAVAWIAFIIQLISATFAGIIGFSLARLIRGPVATWRS